MKKLYCFLKKRTKKIMLKSRVSSEENSSCLNKCKNFNKTFF